MHFDILLMIKATKCTAIGARTQLCLFYFVYCKKLKDLFSKYSVSIKGIFRYVLRAVILLDFKRIERRDRRSTGQSKGWSSTDQGLGVKQLVPSEHHLTEVQLIQYNLCNTHEHFFPLYPTIVTPYRHLESYIMML